MLASRLGGFDGLVVADLFAGSGALGLEALSRGASTAIFVEREPAAIRALKDNIASLRAQSQCDVRPSSVMALPAPERIPDLVLLDPPYESGAGSVALDRLNRLGWIAPGSWICLETSRNEEIRPKGFILDTVRNCGRARLHLLRPE